MYLYSINRPMYEDKIACLEFFCLSGTRTDTGYAVSDTLIDMDTAAYLESCIEIYFMSDSLDSLYRSIKSMNYREDGFKVKVINTGIHISFDTRRQIECHVADIFEGEPDLKNPRAVFVMTNTGSQWIFGKMVSPASNRWRIYNKKPYTFCNSLPSRMSRSLVNMASKGHNKLRLLDPCCGMGSVVLEALDMGIDAYGYDINSNITRYANKNLNYFGFKNRVECLDAIDIHGSFDISVVDLPYGIMSKKGSERHKEIIESVRKVCGRSVILSGNDISGIINGAGFKIVESCIAHKGGLNRHIAVCE